MDGLFWLMLLWPYALAFALLYVGWFVFRLWLMDFFAAGGLARRTKGYHGRHSAARRPSERED